VLAHRIAEAELTRMLKALSAPLEDAGLAATVAALERLAALEPPETAAQGWRDARRLAVTDLAEVRELLNRLITWLESGDGGAA
jgi:hypothetical protein